MSPIQLILIVLIALIAMGIFGVIVLNREATKKNALLNKIKGRGAEGAAPFSAKNSQDKRRAEIAKKLKDSKGEENKKGKKKATIALQIEQAGMKISVRQYWIFSILSMVGLAFFTQIMGYGPHIVLLAGIIGFLGVPRFFLKKMAARRQKKFLEEFPDALEATVRLLRAGMPVAEAVSMIAREFTGPVGEEMAIIYDKQKIGIPLHEAALECTARIPLTEMQMFATGLAIQAQTGSSLSEVLTNLANVIRARFKLKRKIKALSSEAVASAMIIGALPILVATGMYFVNYKYISVLLTDPFGNILLAGAATWMGLGILVMRAMINFKI